mgnify:CR=1 FL=1
MFAQLSTGGLEHGVHAFLVPLRSDSGEVLPGIRIEDNVHVSGDGVENLTRAALAEAPKAGGSQSQGSA